MKTKDIINQLQAECERKDKVIAELKLTIPTTNSGWPYEKKLHETIKAKDAQLAKYKAALEFYAKGEHMPGHCSSPTGEWYSPGDDGQIARAALAEGDE